MGARLAVWSLITLPRTIIAALFTTTDSSHGMYLIDMDSNTIISILGKRHLFYYRQSVWQSLTARALHALLDRGFVRTKYAVFLQVPACTVSKGSLIRTFLAFWVLIHISGSLFSLFWFHSPKECQFSLRVYIFASIGSGLHCWQILILTYVYA